MDMSTGRIGDTPRRNPSQYFTADGDSFRFTEEGTERRARDRGQRIEVAPTDTLQLDIDGPDAYTKFGEMLELYQSCDTLPALGKIIERDSRTPGNKHITIELPTEYPIETRIMLQALLGSDLKRELLALASHHNGHENPIVFYRPQEESNAVTQAGPRNGVDAGSRVVAVRSADGQFVALDANPRRGDAVAHVGRRRRPERLSGRSFTSQLFDDLASVTDGPNGEVIF